MWGLYDRPAGKCFPICCSCPRCSPPESKVMRRRSSKSKCVNPRKFSREILSIIHTNAPHVLLPSDTKDSSAPPFHCSNSLLTIDKIGHMQFADTSRESALSAPKPHTRTGPRFSDRSQEFSGHWCHRHYLCQCIRYCHTSFVCPRSVDNARHL